MFNDMLRTQLLLKNIVTPEDWEYMSDHIQYDFLYDNHFAELKEAELIQGRLELVAQAEPYVGKYYSQDYIRRHILRQTDQEIIEQDFMINKEIKDGVIPDPALMVEPEQPGAPGGVPDAVQNTSAPKDPKPPSGGEI